MDGGMAEDQASEKQDTARAEGGGGLSRRTFIKRTGVAAGGVALLGSLPAALRGTAAGAQAPAGSALGAGEMKTLEALLAQLMPKDGLGPGAVELGVPEYINSSLTTSYKPLL